MNHQAAYSTQRRALDLRPIIRRSLQSRVEGLQKLKYVDFSTSYSIIGNFLRNLGSSNGGTLVEVLILRDCMHLKER
ncbi:hypothetical protein K1719_036622 [Acacia pycnantha]|nr:hypothetical protein K1719_036622 [Acacia pycnantha]